MWEADELSNRVAFINEGKLHAIDTPEALKLAHGKRSVMVRFRDGDGVRSQGLSLDDAATGDQLKSALGSKDLLTIHTEEATLEAVFIKMTGRGLEG
jgi:ABC-2 type transport system ATP-binding protein